MPRTELVSVRCARSMAVAPGFTSSDRSISGTRTNPKTDYQQRGISAAATCRPSCAQAVGSTKVGGSVQEVLIAIVVLVPPCTVTTSSPPTVRTLTSASSFVPILSICTDLSPRPNRPSNRGKLARSRRPAGRRPCRAV